MNGNSRKIWLILGILCLAVAGAAGGIFVMQRMIKQEAERQQEALTAQVNAAYTGEEESEPEPEEATEEESESEPEVIRTWADYSLEEKYRYYEDECGIAIPEKNLDFEAMKDEVNADIYAWICVPGSNVDDPVVQHPTDDYYYLNYNLNGTKGYPGGIYTESCNSKDFSDRMTVIYGHNMKNGKAFGSLHNFEKADVFEENRYIFVYTPEDILVYEIFAAYEGSSNHLVYGHEWDDESWVQYLEDTLLPDWEKHNSLASYDFTPESRVLSLSTCVRNSPNERYLVQGVLLHE